MSSSSSSSKRVEKKYEFASYPFFFLKVVELALHMYGCRVVQVAIQETTGEQQARLVSELQGHVMECVRDQNANHVLQMSVQYAPQNVVKFIIDAFIGQAVDLSKHPYGCRVMQVNSKKCFFDKK